MRKIGLEILYTIFGIGAASGIYYKDDHIYLISDNASLFYDFQVSTQTLKSVPIYLSKELTNIPKAEKLDIEALAYKEDTFYLFGSGSTEKRNTGFHSVTELSGFETFSLESLYEKCRKVSQISKENFNIEGAIFHENHWYLFQRGNGKQNENGVFKLSELKTSAIISYHKINLPKINAVTSGFTDATISNGVCYFIACAENSASTYADGKNEGSIFGILDLNNFQVEHSEILSIEHKFEGITILKEDEKNIDFLLCEDQDSEDLQTKIYRLQMKK